ncbi:MAG: ATP-binding protein, partial [Clostridia bacterium]|nr:ATP-binding protein [Clostridia bacterium]
MTTEIKIFFTYCGADQHLKDIAYSAVLSLAEKYEAQGILLRFIAMDKDCVDRWDIWSKENAVGCDIMVPIITEHSFEAFDGKEKVILREIELGVKHNKRLVPVAFCSLRGKTAKQLCNTSTVFVTENEPEQAFVATMLNKIELLIVDEAERKSEREKLRELRMVSENDKFVGRERELEWLKDSLNSNNIVVLKGEGGTGKTTLAEAFFSRNSAEYIGAYIVAAKNGIKNSIASLPFSRSELSFEERYAENKRKLEFLSHRTIIIFDSCDVEMCEQDVLDELRNVKCKTIITSRDGLSDEGRIPVCTVGRMENEELLALVRSYYPNIDEDNGLSRAEADKRLIELFDYVDGHTLTIEMASAIMFEGDISILAIKEKLLESSEKIKTAKIMKRASAFDHLSALYDFAKLNDKERRVLNALCLISPATGIARTELRELLELDSNNEINELARKTFLRYNKKSKIVSMHALFAEVYYRKSEACRSEEYELVYEELSGFYWCSSNYDYFEMYEMLDFFLQNRSDALSDGEKKRLDASRDNV